MGNLKAEDPFSEIELPEYEPPQYEPTDSHREEDQTPLVYAPDRDVLPKKTYSRWCGLLAIIIFLAIMIGIPLGGWNIYLKVESDKAAKELDSDTNETPANTTLSDLFSASPNKIYTGDALRYDGDDVDSICPGNLTLPYGVMISNDFFEASATRPNSNYNSLCGHQIWASGNGSDGQIGSNIQGANLTLTVIDRCPGCLNGDLKVNPNVMTMLGGVNGTGTALRGVRVTWHFL